MKATELLPLLDCSLAERDALLLASVESGDIVHETVPVLLGGRLTVHLSRDALKWGEAGDAVRLGVSAYTQQQIADVLDCLLLTPLLSDVRAREAVSCGGLVGPFPQSGCPTEAPAYAQHSREIDDALPEGHAGMVAGWKDWCLTLDSWAKRGKATNYGFPVPTGEVRSGSWRGIKVTESVSGDPPWLIQGPHEAHSTSHQDYSQLVALVSRRAELDGHPVDLADVYQGTHGQHIAQLVSHEGPLPGWRLPDVPMLGPSASESAPDDDPYEVAPGVALASQAVSGAVGAAIGAVAGAAAAEALEAMPDTERAPPGPPEVDEFIQARNYTKSKRSLESIRVIVLHSIEGGKARAVARWFGGPSAPKASAHYCVGPGYVVGCVPLEHAAWAAPGCNHDGVQIEMEGWAFKTNWLGDGLPVLKRTAKLVAQLCRYLGIPVESLSLDALKGGARGEVTHALVTKAYRKSSHVDPGGPNDERWPWPEFLGLVRDYLG
jgi:hypothetical protein